MNAIIITVFETLNEKSARFPLKYNSYVQRIRLTGF